MRIKKRQRKLSPYEERVCVTSRLPHATVNKDPNPICEHCGWRTYPLWVGKPHVCPTKQVSDEELKRIRHIAGDLLSNLHFYRIAPDMQVQALAIALAYALGRNSHHRRAMKRWRGLAVKIERLVHREAGGDADQIVAAAARPLRARRSDGRRKKSNR